MTLPLEHLGQIAGRAWLVGGAVRDELIGRESIDYDVALEGEPRIAARALARRADAHAFALSDDFNAWRVVARDRGWQVDLTPLMGETLEHDLSRRDLTINAIARPLGGGELIDPFGGVADLGAGRLRMVSPEGFACDPLRTLRLARLAAELSFAIERETLLAAQRSAGGLLAVAAERVFSELKQIVAGERVLEGLALMEAVGATEVVLPELTALHGVTQSDYHHLDVHDHTIAVLGQTLELQRDPGGVLGAEHAPAIAAMLGEPLADELTRGVALRFGALMHDAAKPQTRAVSAQGRITFMGHDQAGAQLAAAVLARLRASERLSAHVQALTRQHLRLGFLVHEAPLQRRAVYRYMCACEPVEVDVTLLSVADRLATRGRGAALAIERHLTLARELLGEALCWRARRPRPPLRGDLLARAVGIRPGPQLGRILAELEEAAFAGELQTEEQALTRARELLVER